MMMLSLVIVMQGYSQDGIGINNPHTGLPEIHYPTMFDKNQHSTVDVGGIKQDIASKPNLGYIPDKIEGAYVPPPSMDFGNLKNPSSIDGGSKKGVIASIFEGRDNKFATEYYHLSKSHTKSADGTKWIKNDDHFINGIDSEGLNKHYENQENISYSSANSFNEGIIFLLVIVLIIAGGLVFYFYKKTRTPQLNKINNSSRNNGEYQTGNLYKK